MAMVRERTIWNPRMPFDPARLPIFYGWVILGAAIVGFLCSIPGQTIGVSIYTDTYISALGISRMELTTAYLIGTALSGFMVSTGGALFDRLGARKFFVVSAILFGAALIYMSQMDRLMSLFQLTGSTLAAMVVASLGFLGIRFFGQGMITLGSRSVLSKWWNLRRGRMVAISGAFVAFGFSIAPRALDWQVRTFGWRESLLINASVLIIGLPLFAWLVVRDNPEECGLLMDNGWKPEKGRENPDTFLSKEFTKAEAIRTYSFWIITLIVSFHGLFATAYTFHVIDIARSFGVERATILNFFIYSSILSVLANVVTGFVTDHIRLRFVITAFGLCGALYSTGVLLLPTSLGMVLLVAGMGCSWGVFPILSSVGFPRYFGRAHIGAINGASLAWMVWGSALGPLAFSIGKDFLGGYRVPIAASAAIYLLLAIGGVFAQNPSRMAALKAEA